MISLLKKPATALLATILAISTLPTQLTAQETGAFLIADATTGHILSSSGANKKLQVGSLTKIATAMVVLDWADTAKHDLSETATVPGIAVAVQGVNPVGFQPGDRVTLRDLMYAALLQSDNVAALTLADHVGRTLPDQIGNVSPVDRFVAQMNALARSLHMDHTLFLNPHGLEHAERKVPYSTAADMARLSKYAMAKPSFRFYVSQKERRISIMHSGNEQSDYLLQNTNQLLGSNGIDGIKTGRTRLAGECVIISAGRAPESRKQGETYTITPRRLIVVVLDSPERFNIAARLLASGWQAYDQWAAEGRPTKPATTL